MTLLGILKRPRKRGLGFLLDDRDQPATPEINFLPGVYLVLHLEGSELAKLKSYYPSAAEGYNHFAVIGNKVGLINARPEEIITTYNSSDTGIKEKIVQRAGKHVYEITWTHEGWREGAAFVIPNTKDVTEDMWEVIYDHLIAGLMEKANVNMFYGVGLLVYELIVNRIEAAQNL